MGRYLMQPGSLDMEVTIVDGEDEQIADEQLDGYKIFDARHGHTADAWLAFVLDVDVAQRIVNLLNADVERVERQGARVA